MLVIEGFTQYSICIGFYSNCIHWTCTLLTIHRSIAFVIKHFIYSFIYSFIRPSIHKYKSISTLYQIILTRTQWTLTYISYLCFVFACDCLAQKKFFSYLFGIPIKWYEIIVLLSVSQWATASLIRHARWCSANQNKKISSRE